MIEKKYIKKLADAFPEYIEYLDVEEYSENTWSIPIENLAIKIAQQYSDKKLYGENLESIISRWAVLTNEAYSFSNLFKPKLGEFDPSYGYWLALEVFSFYPEITLILEKYLDEIPKGKMFKMINEKD